MTIVSTTKKIISELNGGKMGQIKTDTVMNMQHFHDFYYLQAVEASVTMELAKNPELEFSKQVDKFRDDLDRTIEKVVPNMALRTFMYLYAACLGEARHAKSSVAADRFLSSSGPNGRGDWFSKVTEYPPTKENLDALLDVFAQDWRSGYGGDAWYDIAFALTEYGSLPDAAWLDHVVDLEHNNGTAFSKPDGIYTIFFDVSYPARFSSFLDYKFSKNILEKPPSFTTDALFISPRVYSILNRYSTIFNKKMANFVKQELDNLSDYSVSWGSSELKTEAKLIRWGEVEFGNKPTVESILSAGGFGDIYAGYYPKDKFMKKVESCTERAISKINPKMLNPYVKSQITKAVKKFVKDNIDKCKMNDAKTKYSIMPCKVKTTNGVNTLSFDFPYQDGLGRKKENGFEVDISTLLRIEGEGYVARYYGDLVLWVEDEHYWFSSSVMEALID